MAEAWYVNKYKPAKAKAVRRKNERATMNIWKVLNEFSNSSRFLVVENSIDAISYIIYPSSKPYRARDCRHPVGFYVRLLEKEAVSGVFWMGFEWENLDWSLVMRGGLGCFYLLLFWCFCLDVCEMISSFQFLVD